MAVAPEEYPVLILATVEIIKAKLGIDKFNEKEMRAFDAGVLSCIAATIVTLFEEKEEEDE